MVLKWLMGQEDLGNQDDHHDQEYLGDLEFHRILFLLEVQEYLGNQASHLLHEFQEDQASQVHPRK